jgi:hypothetical protein
MLYNFRIEEIMTCLLRLKISHFARHCRKQFQERKVLTDELCTVQGERRGCCDRHLHVMFGTI